MTPAAGDNLGVVAGDVPKIPLVARGDGAAELSPELFPGFRHRRRRAFPDRGRAARPDRDRRAPGRLRHLAQPDAAGAGRRGADPRAARAHARRGAARPARRPRRVRRRRGARPARDGRRAGGARHPDRGRRPLPFRGAARPLLGDRASAARCRPSASRSTSRPVERRELLLALAGRWPGAEGARARPARLSGGVRHGPGAARSMPAPPSAAARSRGPTAPSRSMRCPTRPTRSKCLIRTTPTPSSRPSITRARRRAPARAAAGRAHLRPRD